MQEQREMNKETETNSNPYNGFVFLQDLESWVSGEHGFVVFTLGTMVSDMPEETTSVFLEAFRQIPQKVKEYL